MARIPSDIAKAVAWFSRIEDPDPREGILREALKTWDAVNLAALFLELTGEIHRSSHRSVYVTLLRILVIGDPLPDVVRQDVYSIAAEAGRRDAVRILLPVPAKRGARVDELRIDPVLEEMPLGMQKWRARGQNSDLLAKLAVVPHPDVIAIWLANPRATEPEVLRIAAKRPAYAPCLLKILKSKRWASRTRLQEALAQNPYTPTHIAAGLLHVLGNPLLEQISLTGVLHPLIRETARDIVARRRPS